MPAHSKYRYMYRLRLAKTAVSLKIIRESLSLTELYTTFSLLPHPHLLGTNSQLDQNHADPHLFWTLLHSSSPLHRDMDTLRGRKLGMGNRSSTPAGIPQLAPKCSCLWKCRCLWRKHPRQ